EWRENSFLRKVVLCHCCTSWECHYGSTYGKDRRGTYERQKVRCASGSAGTPRYCAGTFGRADSEEDRRVRGGAHSVCIFPGLVDRKRRSVRDLQVPLRM